MDLKLLSGNGQKTETGRGVRRAVRPRVQRSADPPGRGRLPGERAPGHARAEGPRRHQQVAQEALGAEGHRPRARGPGQQPAVARRRQDLPVLARRELLAQGEPQDVPRGPGVDPVAARARGPAVGDRRRSRSTAPKTKALRAEDQGVRPDRHRAGRHRQARRATRCCRRATCRTCSCSRRARSIR